MNPKHKIKCPYCQNEFYFPADIATYETVFCDTDDSPGCGKLFVLFSTLTFSFETKKVEGE